MTCMLCAYALHAQPLTIASAVGPQPFLPGSPILPVPGSRINYTQVMFDHPPVEKAAEYVMIVKDSTSTGVVGSQTSTHKSTSVWFGGFTFGSECSWFYRALNAKGKVIFTSPTYRFTILPLPDSRRVRVTVNDQLNSKPGLISFDRLGLIVDREGKPVWFLPDQFRTQYTRDGVMSDIRVSTAGTITFISRRRAYEIMPDGRISWSASETGPLHDAVERLPNGNLMVLGTHTVQMPVPFEATILPVDFGMLLEYDRAGNIVWKWDAYSYLRPAETEFRKSANGQWVSSSGLNSFRYVKEAGVEYVYANFRDLNRVVKIEKSSGKITAVYGRRMDGGYGWKDDRFFAAQNDAAVLRDGNMAVFNNDSVMQSDVVSSLVIFSPAKSGEEPKLLWRFAGNFDAASPGKSETGGSVEELADGNLLLNFGSTGRCVEITREGKVVWSAWAESQAVEARSWLPVALHHSHFAKSLYPVWFSVGLLSDTKKASTITISNDGDEADSYSVQYLANGKWILLSSVNLDPAQQTTCIIPKVKTLPFTKIRVVSAHNPDFVRTIAL